MGLFDDSVLPGTVLRAANDWREAVPQEKLDAALQIVQDIKSAHLAGTIHNVAQLSQAGSQPGVVRSSVAPARLPKRNH